LSIIPAAVFILCFATSLVCAALLLRQYQRTRTNLLFWSALCFAFLTLNNLFLVCNLIVFPNMDFLPLRQATSLVALGMLLYGFIWKAD
jgi:amino acid permease